MEEHPPIKEGTITWEEFVDMNQRHLASSSLFHISILFEDSKDFADLDPEIRKKVANFIHGKEAIECAYENIKDHIQRIPVV